MARIRQLDSGRWQVLWREGGGRDGRAQTETFEKKDPATRFRGLVDAAEQQWPSGWVKGVGMVEVAVVTPTLAEWFERTQKSNITAGSETLRKYAQVFDAGVPSWLANKPIDRITREDAGLWVNEIRRTPSARTGRPLSVKSVHNLHGVVSTTMKLALRDGHIRINPFSGVLGKRESIEHEDMIFLEPDEFEILYTAMDPHYQPLTSLLFATGLRYSEATALMGRDFDPVRGTLRVRQAWKKIDGGWELGAPKTAAGRRVIGLDAEQIEYLTRRQAAPGELIFQTTEGARVMHSFFHARKWQPALFLAAQMGLRKQPRIHDLRHSHAGWLLSSGAPIYVVSRRLGHASIKVTADTYGHLTAESEDLLIAMVHRAGEIRRATTVSFPPLRVVSDGDDAARTA